eukprot:5830189-Amphidinium_carterae.1
MNLIFGSESSTSGNVDCSWQAPNSIGNDHGSQEPAILFSLMHRKLRFVWDQIVRKHPYIQR